MSRTTIASYKQSVFDIAIKMHGNVSGIWDVIEKNNLDFATEIEAGAELLVDDNIDVPELVSYFADNKINPATQLEVEELPDLGQYENSQYNNKQYKI